MPATVVILSSPQDTHAHAMCEALERKGARARFVYTPDFPGRTSFTIKPDAKAPALFADGPERMEFGGDCASVWLRRPFYANVPEDFDETDRKMIDRECRHMRESFFDLLCPSALWVNPLGTYHLERCKPTQLVMAQRCGLRVPPTLISNDPREILAFFRAAGRNGVIYKTFSAFVPTSLLTEELLADPDVLRWTPGIYQHYVEKDHELRVTVIGSRIFAVRINSQQTVRGTVDWRQAQLKPRGEAGDLTFAPSVLPRPVREACSRLMRALGLAYGAIDLIVTPDGEHVFLEVNPSGQFLWAEYEAGLPLLDAMSEMLNQGTVAYRWNPRAPRIRFDSELLEAAKARERRSMDEHVCDVQR